MPLPDGDEFYHPVPPEFLTGNKSYFDRRGMLRYHFDGVVEAVESAASGRWPGHGGRTQYHSHENSAYYSWDFSLGWDGAVRTAVEGWPEGRENIEVLAASIRENIERTSVVSYQRPLIVADVAGPIVNVPAHLAGVPEAMFDWRNEEQTAPIVSIVIEATASAGISADFYSARGSAIVALIDMLESSGRRCEVTLVDTMVSGYGEKWVADLRTTLKRAGDHVNIDSLAFAIAHPAYFRRIGFAHIENLPMKAASQITNDGYGMPTPTPFERGDVYLPPVHLNDKEWANQEGARAWVIERLKEHGVVA